METNAFTAALRTHEGNGPQKNAQIYSDPETLQAFARAAKIYRALSFYRTQLFKEAETKGYPVVRHPVLHYQADLIVQNLQGQFMLGSEIMVAPIFYKKASTNKLYLPQGKWTHLWTGKSYEITQTGLWATVNAPYGEPPVFIKSESAILTPLLKILRDEKIVNW